MDYIQCTKCGKTLDHSQHKCPIADYAMLTDARAIVTRKFLKGIDLDNSVTGNEKRLAVIIECELIDDFPEGMIGKTIMISEHFS